MRQVGVRRLLAVLMLAVGAVVGLTGAALTAAGASTYGYDAIATNGQADFEHVAVPLTLAGPSKGSVSPAALSFGASTTPVARSVATKSPHINPADIAGKTPAEIDAIARQNGLVPKGPDPASGKGPYTDPVTGQQRVLCHPSACPPHAHVNNPSGERLDINGNVVAPESPEAHLPLGGRR